MHRKTNWLNKWLISVTALLASCSNSMYSFEPTQNKEGEELLVITTFSQNMKKDSWKKEEGLKGQTLYSPDDNLCEIVIDRRMAINEQQKTLGHELMHCLYGDYHK